MLSDKDKRAIYDQYGEAGLKGGPPPPDPTQDAGMPGAQNIPGGGGFKGFGRSGAFSAQDAIRLFESMFGGEGGEFSFGNDDAMGGSFPGIGGPFGGKGGMGGMGGMGGGAKRPAPRSTDSPLAGGPVCGMPKKLKMTRRVHAGEDSGGRPSRGAARERSGDHAGDRRSRRGGRQTRVESRDETHVRGQGLGATGHPGKPARPRGGYRRETHAVFKRDGDDLVYVCAITLRQALCGFKLTFRGVDGEDVGAAATGEVTSPGGTVRVKKRHAEPQRPGSRGDVIVKVDRVDFPKRATETQRAGFKELLSGAK